MKRLLNAVVWTIFAAALLIQKHRKRREERNG